MTPVIEISPSLAPHQPQKVDNCWIVGMPKEIAEAFGLPEGWLVALFAQPGSVIAQTNLAGQTSEARHREPGWFIKMPSEMAEAAKVAEGSLIAIYAKSGALYVEILPPPSPELKASINRILNKYKEAFEEMKRRGD